MNKLEYYERELKDCENTMLDCTLNKRLAGDALAHNYYDLLYSLAKKQHIIVSELIKEVNQNDYN